ncbi:MAG: Metal dependent phosphohydrolase [Nitrosopumilales archaeon]|nr:MAG: Metal dependent phosphohydrolase [Nitrosopumilales archaeon]
MEILPEIFSDVKKRMKKNDPAHDFEHVMRVFSNAEKICKKENANKKLVLYSALLHDIVSFPKNDKRSKNSSTKSSLEAKKILSKFSFSHDEIKIISDAIESHSFSKNKKAKTLEEKILQDADRLDAIGAIGIARTFAVGGSENRSFYNKLDPFCSKRNPNDKNWILDHFYKKLLLIEKKMNTKSGKFEAKRRTKIIKKFLSDLEQEI